MQNFWRNGTDGQVLVQRLAGTKCSTFLSTEQSVIDAKGFVHLTPQQTRELADYLYMLIGEEPKREKVFSLDKETPYLTVEMQTDTGEPMVKFNGETLGHVKSLHLQWRDVGPRTLFELTQEHPVSKKIIETTKRIKKEES